ncbi:sodium:solute symporter family protein [Halobacteriovorax sp. GB3]|uniref:sodium:solute symporter family protein n=1 Tax=Halobacteriovorax sp. GB3 TaxID=2719615 RepID=UPI00235E63B6|nr:sodium:solute symporter family protein [Halobacteriovorax sp. GB3]MDD0854858.1 sodium:solute symporter family protein [Halobacteriovorax sp. GB3]
MQGFQQSVDIQSLISPLDWVVFAFTIALTAASVLYGNSLKKKTTNEKDNFLDLLLMGRKLTLPLFVSTLVATWYGGIFGVTEIAFNNGIYNFITQGAFWYVAYLIFAFFIIHKIKSYQAVTLPDLIGKMFGPNSAKLSALFNLFNVLPIAYTISLGLFLQTLFGGELLFNMSIGLIFVVLYSMWGGLRSVVFSDIIQFFVMCLGVFLVFSTSISTFGGLDFLKANLPTTHFEPLGGHGLATTLVWGLIALSTLVDPNFYQRCFAAESEKTAKKGIIISTGIWFLFDICTTFGAMYARAVLPEAESSTAYLTYAVQLLPDGLRGLFLAGILATILSTLDSYLFLAGTTITFDLLPIKWREKVSIHHLGVLSTAFISLILAYHFDGNIKLVWKTLGSYSAACLLLPVLFGYLFPGKISDKQFLFSSILGIVFTTYWRNAPLPGFYAQIDELYAGIVATSMGLIICRTLANFRSN